MKNIAVQGCSIEITDKSLNAATMNITTAPSTKTKADGKAAYRGNLSVSLVSIQDAAGNIAPTATLTISGSSQKTQIDGQAAVLEGDSGKASQVTFTNPNTGAQVPHDIEVKITDAGQSKFITE